MYSIPTGNGDIYHGNGSVLKYVKAADGCFIRLNIKSTTESHDNLTWLARSRLSD